MGLRIEFFARATQEFDDGDLEKEKISLRFSRIPCRDRRVRDDFGLG